MLHIWPNMLIWQSIWWRIIERTCLLSLVDCLCVCKPLSYCMHDERRSVHHNAHAFANTWKRNRVLWNSRTCFVYMLMMCTKLVHMKNCTHANVIRILPRRVRAAHTSRENTQYVVKRVLFFMIALCMSFKYVWVQSTCMPVKFCACFLLHAGHPFTDDAYSARRDGWPEKQ